MVEGGARPGKGAGRGSRVATSAAREVTCHHALEPRRLLERLARGVLVLAVDELAHHAARAVERGDVRGQVANRSWLMLPQRREARGSGRPRSPRARRSRAAAGRAGCLDVDRHRLARLDVDSRRTTAPISGRARARTHIELAPSASAVLTPTNGAGLGTRRARSCPGRRRRTCARRRASGPRAPSCAAARARRRGRAASPGAGTRRRARARAARVSTASAGTFCCLISVSCPGASSPKLALSASSAAVASCVSSDVMIASGRKPRGARLRACSARIWRARGGRASAARDRLARQRDLDARVPEPLAEPARDEHEAHAARRDEPFASRSSHSAVPERERLAGRELRHPAVERVHARLRVERAARARARAAAASPPPPGAPALSARAARAARARFRSSSSGDGGHAANRCAWPSAASARAS